MNQSWASLFINQSCSCYTPPLVNIAQQQQITDSQQSIAKSIELLLLPPYHGRGHTWGRGCFPYQSYSSTIYQVCNHHGHMIINYYHHQNLSSYLLVVQLLILLFNKIWMLDFQIQVLHIILLQPSKTSLLKHPTQNLTQCKSAIVYVFLYLILVPLTCIAYQLHYNCTLFPMCHLLLKIYSLLVCLLLQ